MHAMQFIFTPALLSSESEAEFNALRAEISSEIQPKGIIEQTTLTDLR